MAVILQMEFLKVIFLNENCRFFFFFNDIFTEICFYGSQYLLTISHHWFG